MRTLLLLSFLAVSPVAALAQAPTAAPPQQPRPPAAPTAPSGQGAGQAPTPAPAPRRAAPAAQAASARTGLAVTVTSPTGTRLGEVHVQATGPSDRMGDTDAAGQVNFTGLQTGTYRLRFSGPTVTAFEREVTIRAGQVASLDITLTPAPPPPAPPPAPEPVASAAPAAAGPRGQPQVLSVVDFLDKELIKNEPRKETLISCSGNTRTTLAQMNQDQATRLYESAEVTYYVVAGEGAVRIDGRDATIAAGAFVAIPRGTGHALVRRGRRPLIVVTTLSGEPCEQAK